jgi:DNA repair photolyase
MPLVIKEILCQTAISKNGFPGGGWAINPYVGCGHNCAYCYARFMKRFTGHKEKWGSFVDVRTNIVEVLQKQLRSNKYKSKRIYLGTVTDPYQPLEKKYQLTRQILQLLKDYGASISILTKSDLVLHDLDLIEQFKDIDIDFTVNTLNENWKRFVEPNSPAIKNRLQAAQILTQAGIAVFALVGPYWPVFTEIEKLFTEFQKIGVKRIFVESFNTIGGNYTEVKKILRHHFPSEFPAFEKIIKDKNQFDKFYLAEGAKIKALAQEYQIPAAVYFGRGHAAKRESLFQSFIKTSGRKNQGQTFSRYRHPGRSKVRPARNKQKV